MEEKQVAEIKRDNLFQYSPEVYPNHRIIMGGNDSNPTWREYLGNWKDEFQPYIVAIRKTIEKEGMVGTVAGDVCNDIYFSFKDGTQISFSWRAWGDLMQAIVDKQEGYMAYYM